LLRFVVGSAVAIGLAYLSRKYYEEWFLQLKERVAPQSAASQPVVPRPAIDQATSTPVTLL
jgi:peptidoglycan/LPS O-acetylase OafA/YrhL